MHHQRRLLLLMVASLSLWSCFIVFLYTQSAEDHRHSIVELAVSEARITFEKDLTYRRWSAMMGGVYVPVTETLKPNPYLEVPERDIRTTTGRDLTLINPAYMSRMVNSILQEDAGVKAKITSSNPINPINMADSWELAALRTFEGGGRELHEIVDLDGKQVLRFIRAMITEQPCLKCHAHQGYTLGDVRGALSITVPMQRFEPALNAINAEDPFRYGGIWLAGAGFICFGFTVLIRDDRFRLDALQKQKEAEQRIRRSEEFLQSLYQNSAMGIFVLDVAPDGSLAFSGVNPSFSVLSGCSEQALRGNSLAALRGNFSAASLDVLADLCQQCVAEGRILERELLMSGHGDDEWWLSRMTPILDETGGWVGRIVGNVLPVTTLKRAEESMRVAKEQAESSSRTKSEFLANMSHEIRTPLNGVTGMLQLLEMTDATQEQTEYIHAALTASERLTRLLSDILDLSRIEAGKLILQSNSFLLDEVRTSVIDIFARSARDKGLELSFDIDDHLPRMLYGDEARLRQILFNLVGNSIKFTDQGSVQVSVILLSRHADTLRILFSVADSGIGIADDCLQEIFDPFVQGEETYTKQHQGAGLGLAIVKRLIQLMDGTLSVDTAAGDGTTICFVLDLCEGTDGKSVRSSESRSEKRGLTILLVEDDLINRVSGSRILEKLGYRVLMAENGEEALRQMASNEVDMVFMDIQMPVMNGMEAMTAIRDLSAPASATPVVAMTGYAMVGDMDRFKQAGFDDYVSKPVSVASLQNVITRVRSDVEASGTGRTDVVQK